jgi:hypothetical protein
MRRRYKILASAAVIAVLLFAMWLALHNRIAQHSLGIGFTSSPVVAEQPTILWVTNTGRSAVTLDQGYVRFEDAAGRRVRDLLGPSWNGQTGHSPVVLPGKSAWLSSGYPVRDATRFKFVFDYHWNGSPLVRLISKGTGVFPLKALPSRTYDWLLQNGLVDGMLRGHYESPLVVKPQGTGSASQPTP